MSDKRPRLTTRGIATAEAIRDRRGFTTSGALSARHTSLGVFDRGYLSGPDEQVFREQCSDIDYVVWSYSTPIAWWSEKHGWHVVSQKFSVTTTKHQGNLYLIPRD